LADGRQKQEVWTRGELLHPSLDRWNVTKFLLLAVSRNEAERGGLHGSYARYAGWYLSCHIALFDLLMLWWSAEILSN